MGKKILVWFRNDLRVHDNEVLTEAVAKADEILPVYIFDPRQFEKTKFGTLKTGYNRAQFLLESVADLQDVVKGLGGKLLVQTGLPEEIIPGLVARYEINEVYHHREVASEETAVSTAVEDALWKLKVNLKHFIGHTLYNKEDLPFPIKDIPDVFAQFKKKTERESIVKPCLPTPGDINFVKAADGEELPLLHALYGEEISFEPQNYLHGGQTEALNKLHDFLHKGEDIAQQQTSLKKQDVFSQLSPWLGLGCLSPRQVYWAMKDAEANYGLKPFFGQIVLGLLWRDYYRFMFKKYGNKFFRLQGFANETDAPEVIDETQFENWKNGQTENETVNQIMKALNKTGYATNLGRQLLAVYLVQALKLNWIFGAYYFEEILLDYSPASNWGNWAHMAGVGNDKRLSQSFDFEKLLKQVEGKGSALHSLRV